MKNAVVLLLALSLSAMPILAQTTNVEQWLEPQKELVEAINAGRFEGVRAKCTKAIANAKKAQDPVTQLSNMYVLGLLYAKQKRNKDLSALLDQAIPLSEKTNGESDRVTQKFRQLTGPLEEAKTKRTEWQKFMDAGKTAQSSADYAKAISDFGSAAKEADRVAPGSLSYGTALVDLGTAYFASGQYKQAEDSLSKALFIFQRYYPDDAQEMVAFRAIHSKAKELSAQALPAQ